MWDDLGEIWENGIETCVLSYVKKIKFLKKSKMTHAMPYISVLWPVCLSYCPWSKNPMVYLAVTSETGRQKYARMDAVKGTDGRFTRMKGCDAFFSA